LDMGGAAGGVGGDADETTDFRFDDHRAGKGGIEKTGVQFVLQASRSGRSRAQVSDLRLAARPWLL
jgi:hypothetical protein